MKRVALVCFLVLWALMACAKPVPKQASTAQLKPIALPAGSRLKVVATTSIVEDIVANVGRDLIDLRRLLPLGTDPHSFEPTPRDVAMLSDAHVIMANGAGLEEFLDPLLKNAGAKAVAVDLSDGVTPRKLGEQPKGAAPDGPGGSDPHTWTTAANAIVFVRNAARALAILDPAHASAYQTNAERYEAQLKDLDGWIKAQIATIPAANRRLVTDHESFGYYGAEYGLEIVGAVIPSFSTVAEPSVQQMAALEDAVRQQGVKAIFVDTTVSPVLAQRVAADTGTKLVLLYSGSLGPAGSGAETYLDYMRYNTRVIVEALR